MNNTLKIYMLALFSFLVGTSQFVIAGILDRVATSVNLSVSTAGQLVTAFSLAYAVGTPIVMMAIAKINLRKKLFLALSIILLGIIMTLILPGFALLTVSRVVLGIGTGVFTVTAYSAAAKLASPGRQGRAMSNISLGMSASLVLGIPIGRVISTTYDWKVIFWGIGFFTLLGIIAVAKLIPSMESEASVPLSKQLALFKNPKITFCLGLTLFVFIGYSVINTYIAPFLKSVVSLSEGTVSIVLFALGVASVIGSKLGGFMVDWVGTTHTLVIGMVIQAFALAFLFIVAKSTIMAISLLLLWATAAWMFGLAQNHNMLSIATEASGITLSLNSSFVQLGFAIGAAVGGIVVSSLSLLAISWIGAVSILVGAVSFGFAHRFSKDTDGKLYVENN